MISLYTESCAASRVFSWVQKHALVLVPMRRRGCCAAPLQHVCEQFGESSWEQVYDPDMVMERIQSDLQELLARTSSGIC
jgi:hypothetical protein